MSSDNNSTTIGGPAPSASILRVWDIVNRHFDLLLSTAEGSSASKTRAEINIRSQAKELRDLMGACSKRLKTIEAFVSELQERETGDLRDDRPSRQTRSSELLGEWHFLYMEDNRVFGYMKMVPETVSVVPGEHGAGSFKRAEFTIPSGSLDAPDGDSAPDHGNDSDYAPCPCCQLSVKVPAFWKHALFEIADRGNRVPARRTLDRSETPVWIVEDGSGWSTPIYRPRGLDSTCEIGQSLAELNLKHFLSDYDFSRVLDRTFEFLALQLRT